MTLPRRRFGGREVELSALSFGSMRLRAERSDRQHLELLLHLVDRGVTTFHSSSEYETFPRFTSLLRELQRARPQARLEHVVKLAAPHFGEDRFVVADLVRRLDAYRAALSSPRIDVVQWMVRFDLQQENRRLQILQESAAELGDAVACLREQGWIGAFACFPYTQGFAQAVLAQPWCDGLVDYLNLHERERVALLPELQRAGQGLVALRPLLAGELIGRASPAAALRFPLLHPAVASEVLSIGSIAHAEVAFAALDELRPDPDAFQSAAQAL